MSRQKTSTLPTLYSSTLETSSIDLPLGGMNAAFQRFILSSLLPPMAKTARSAFSRSPAAFGTRN